ERVLGRVTAGCVGEEVEALRVHVVPDRVRVVAVELHPPHGDRDHVGPARRVTAGHLLGGAVLSGAHDEPGGELAASDDQGIVHLQPPPTKPTISTTSPSAILASAYAARGTTSRFT